MQRVVTKTFVLTIFITVGGVVKYPSESLLKRLGHSELYCYKWHQMCAAAQRPWGFSSTNRPWGLGLKRRDFSPDFSEQRKFMNKYSLLLIAILQFIFESYLYLFIFNFSKFDCITNSFICRMKQIKKAVTQQGVLFISCNESSFLNPPLSRGRSIRTYKTLI